MDDGALSSYVSRPYPGGEGRGVVIPAGGAYLLGAYVSICVLWELGCRWPVEIWHMGSEEIGDGWSKYFECFSHVRFRDIGHGGGPRERGGWQLKAEALAASAFETVLLLDADNLPLRDPSFLADSNEFRAVGALFWPMPGLAPIAFESGQMLVDRKRCWSAVDRAAYYNRHADTYWKGLWGDKDTFLLAWKSEARSYAMPDKRPFANEEFILQFGFDDAPLFQHRYGAKWKPRDNRFLYGGAAEEAAHRVIRLMEG